MLDETEAHSHGLCPLDHDDVGKAAENHQVAGERREQRQPVQRSLRRLMPDRQQQDDGGDIADGIARQDGRRLGF